MEDKYGLTVATSTTIKQL